MALEAVREAFEIFVSKIDDKEGVTCLGIALDSANEFNENGCSTQEDDIVANLVRTCQDRVMKKVKKEISSGTPDSKQLAHLDRLMRHFADSGFAENSDFQAIKAEVSTRLFDQTFIELWGKRLSEFTAAEKASLIKLLEAENEMGGSNP